MNAREKILLRIRGGLGKGDVGVRRVAAEVSMKNPQPQLAGHLDARFASRAPGLASSVDQGAGLVAVPSAVAAYLTTRGLAPPAVMTGDLAHLDWSEAGITISRRAEHGTLPCAVNFISGLSRTGAIEQTFVLGADGLCRVHPIPWGERS